MGARLFVSIHFDETFCENSVDNSDCRTFGLFETVVSSRIKTTVILWYAQAWRIHPLQIHNNFQNRLAILNNHRIFSLGSKEAFCRNSINISNCRFKRNFFKGQADTDLQYAQARFFHHLANERNFRNRSTFLKKHQIPSRSLRESFSGNSLKMSDYRAFSPFETLPGCWTFRHSKCGLR